MQSPALSLLVSALALFGPAASVAAHATSLRERLAGLQAGGHRGGEHFPWWGNTLANFERAADEGVDILEMDLWLSSDGVPHVFHDPTLDSKTNCSGRIDRRTSASIRESCRYDWTGQRIPTFREVLAWAADKRNARGHLVLNAELKEDAVIESSLALAREFDGRDWIYFQVQDSREKYERVRRIDPSVTLLYSPKDDAGITWALGLEDPNLLIIEIHEDNGTKGWIDRIHAAGKLVSENSFQRGSELLGARCEEVFADGIDIAVSKRAGSCVNQRESVTQAHPGTTR